MPAASPLLMSGLTCVASSPVVHNRVIAAGRDSDFVAGSGLVEQFPAKRNVVDADRMSWLLSREEELWDVLLKGHFRLGWLVGGLID